jgi:hypothetical protein
MSHEGVGRAVDAVQGRLPRKMRIDAFKELFQQTSDDANYEQAAWDTQIYPNGLGVNLAHGGCKAVAQGTS